jgi:hypothetical protein
MRSLVVAFVGACMQLAVAHAAPELGLAQPEAPPARVVVEDGPSPMYYRLREDTLAFAWRTSLGAAFRDGDQAFQLSMLLGAATRFGRGARSGLWAEAGYAYETFHEHLFVVGVGPALRGPEERWNVLLVPHAVIGSVDGQTGYGVRTSLAAVWLGCGVEIAYQLMIVGTRHVNEILVSYSVPVALR